MKVALVHDDLTQPGGAERVVVSLHRMFPDAPIYTAAFDPEGTHPELRNCDVRTGFLQRLPHRNGAARALLPLYPAAMRAIDLSGYDLVISSSSRFAHGVRVPNGQHVCYCHNPPRFLYDTTSYLADAGPAPRLARPALRPVLSMLRRWDRSASSRPDVYVANSRTVADRIEHAYGRSSVVINPPLDLGRFTKPGRTSVPAVPDEPYFLVVARLLPYKRVDLAVEACRRIGARLVVVGDGPARDSLVRQARGEVDFRGRVSDSELVALLRACIALIQCGAEDFGFGPLEANAAGRPVVARAVGGALETVAPGSTGVLFEEASVEALCGALQEAQLATWDPELLYAHASTFSEERFHRELAELLSSLGLPEPIRGAPRIADAVIDGRPVT